MSAPNTITIADLAVDAIIYRNSGDIDAKWSIVDIDEAGNRIYLDDLDRGCEIAFKLDGFIRMMNDCDHRGRLAYTL